MATSPDATRSIAHDLRNLLTAARGHAELALLSLEAGDEAREDVARVVVVTTAALEFVEQLGGRPDAAAGAGSTDLDEAIGELTPLVRALVPHGVAVELRLEAGRHIPLTRLQLEQVLLNLVMNASDAMPDGGRLSVTTAADSDGVRLDVRDTGPGFSVEALAHLFEEGFTTKRPGRGTGRGLVGCRRIARSAGGELVVASATDGGALVSLVLPVA